MGGPHVDIIRRQDAGCEVSGSVSEFEVRRELFEVVYHSILLGTKVRPVLLLLWADPRFVGDGRLLEGTERPCMSDCLGLGRLRN